MFVACGIWCLSDVSSVSPSSEQSCSAYSPTQKNSFFKASLRAFYIYMNNLPNVTKECETEFYVDDIKIYLSIQPIDLENGILRVAACLNRIAEWCCSHRMLISPKKTKLILSGVSYILSGLPTISIEFLGQLLTPVPACKDLGLTLDSHLSFNNHISTLTSSLLSSLCQINRVKHLFSEKTLLLPINSLVFS